MGGSLPCEGASACWKSDLPRSGLQLPGTSHRLEVLPIPLLCVSIYTCVPIFPYLPLYIFLFIHVCVWCYYFILFFSFSRYIDEYALPEYDVQSSFQFRVLDRTFDLFFDRKKEGLTISNDLYVNRYVIVHVSGR